MTNGIVVRAPIVILSAAKNLSLKAQGGRIRREAANKENAEIKIEQTYAAGLALAVA
jgi:hypothetical protein